MKLRLRGLLFLVTILAVVLTLFSSVIASTRVSKETLITHTLETNRVYAQKLANTTNEYLDTTLQTLEYSATHLTKALEKENSTELLYEEAERLLHQTSTFNSVVITSAEGEIVAASPESLEVIGEQLDAPAERKALADQKASITPPYVTLTGRLIIFISQPIFDVDGNYYGMVGGTIYLLSDNILYDFLGEHYYQDGSYVYVVDENGYILYHPDKERIDDQVLENPIAGEITQGNSGSMEVTNTKNIDMLAGYAYMPTTNWGVVSQRPVDAALKPSTDLRNEMIFKTLPYMIILIIVVVVFSEIISRPLKKLADYARKIIRGEREEEIQRVGAWYYEASKLEDALFQSYNFYKDQVDHFSKQSITDPLTGLVNRRMMQQMMSHWEVNERIFSIIILDIDHFKHVNDTYGHQVGDEVLIFLADLMQELTGEHDICCRYGGEEFIILLPEATKKEAFARAEKIRRTVEQTISPSGEAITVSLGVSEFPQDSSDLMKIIEIADNRLYHAKRTGRNRTIMDDQQ